jgi:hypothetical protein
MPIYTPSRVRAVPLSEKGYGSALSAKSGTSNNDEEQAEGTATESVLTSRLSGRETKKRRIREYEPLI